MHSVLEQRTDKNNTFPLGKQICFTIVWGCAETLPMGKISAQPHPTLCIQFLNRENNDKNNTLPLGKQICFTIVWGCAEILPKLLSQRWFHSDICVEQPLKDHACFGKISAQPHTSLCIQFLNRENNDKNNTFPLGKQRLYGNFTMNIFMVCIQPWSVYRCSQTRNGYLHNEGKVESSSFSEVVRSAIFRWWLCDPLTKLI